MASREVNERLQRTLDVVNAEGASGDGGGPDGAGAGAKGGDKPWDEADIDKWAPVKIRPEDNPGGMIEESSFAVLFPKVGAARGGRAARAEACAAFLPALPSRSRARPAQRTNCAVRRPIARRR